MCGAMSSMSLDELGFLSIQLVDGRRCLDAGRKTTIFLFMVVDTNHTCGLDGTQVLSRNGRSSSTNMQRRKISKFMGIG